MVEQIDTEQIQQQYFMKVSNELLTQAHILDINTEELLEFFAVQVQAMLACPPNFKYAGQLKQVWILRGFYSTSSLFFKLIVMRTEGTALDTCGYPYYAKATPLRINQGWAKKEKNTTINSGDLNDNITNRMENSFFNTNHKIKKLIPTKIRMPRCISPKGMKLLKFQKRSKKE